MAENIPPDHLNALYNHSAKGLVDYMIVNDQDIPDYFSEICPGGPAVEIDWDKLAKLSVRCCQPTN